MQIYNYLFQKFSFQFVTVEIMIKQKATMKLKELQPLNLHSYSIICLQKPTLGFTTGRADLTK